MKCRICDRFTDANQKSPYGPVFVKKIPKFSQIFSHERNWQKKLSHFWPKHQFCQIAKCQKFWKNCSVVFFSFFCERISERIEKLLFTKTGPMISVASKAKNMPRAEGLHSDLAASNSLEMARRFPKTLESVHSCNNNNINY